MSAAEDDVPSPEPENTRENGADNTSREPQQQQRRKRNIKPNQPDVFKIDLGEFVKSVSEYLKEEKIHLVKVAVEVLGIKMISELLNEVDAIEHNGGQMTADGKRRRTPGGVLWNMLKTRLEPQLYKNIILEANGGKRKKKRRRRGDNAVETDDQDLSMGDVNDTDALMRDAGDQSRRRRKRRKVEKMEVGSDQLLLLEEGEQPQQRDLDACPSVPLPTSAAIAQRRTVDYSDL